MNANVQDMNFYEKVTGKRQFLTIKKYIASTIFYCKSLLVGSAATNSVVGGMDVG